MIRLTFLFLYALSKKEVVIFIINERKGLCLSRTFFLNKILDIAGAKVKANISAQSNANPSVNARGANILPSTF